MQTLYARLNQIKTGFSGSVEESCYNYIGRVLQRRGDALRHAVIAFYSTSGKNYIHAAIETEDGLVIAERYAPSNFREHDGWVAQDTVRSSIFVSAVMSWLLSTQSNHA